MKLFKMTKKKIIVGVLAISLFSGLTFALANTEAGQALKDWYNHLFNQKVDMAMDEANQYGESLMPGLLDEYADEKAHAEGIIDRKKAYELGKSTEAIKVAKDAHLESLGDAKADILDGMDLQFFQVFVEGAQEIERLGSEASLFVQSDLADHFGNKRDSTLADIENELTQVKNEALSDLEAAIEAAKVEIEAEVDSRSDVLVSNLKTRIDHKIDELRREVRSIIVGYTAEIENAIVLKADEMENEAKLAMDQLISDLTN
ncbi:MAG TPA: hypothetical protein VIG73_12370 [Cerasibacillus sp.]|uniref:hypothetical protein n=1 Tax=Cerasibacillus sp. TaxID=2498711 RepID=UPI002F413B44